MIYICMSDMDDRVCFFHMKYGGRSQNVLDLLIPPTWHGSTELVKPMTNPPHFNRNWHKRYTLFGDIHYAQTWFQDVLRYVSFTG